MMEIGFVKDAVYPWEVGGAQKRNWEIARRLSDNHEVHLFGMQYWDGPETIEKEGVTLHGVCKPKELYVDGRRSISQALHFTRKVVVELLQHDIDVIDCQKSSLFPFFASKVHTGIKESALVGMWTEIWDDYWYEYLGRKGIFGKVVERTALRLPDINIAISESVEQQMRSVSSIDNISVVHNGVDYQGIQDVEPSESHWDVIYIGRLSEHKNVDVLINAVIEAANHVDRDFDCAIVGDGPEREYLERYNRSQGGDENIEFLGFLNESELMGNLKSSSVFVHPSSREGFPNAILEANACGVPTITIDEPRNGGKAIVKNDETGYVTELSHEAIADRILNIVTDSTLRDRLSSASKQYGAAHDWDVIVDETEQIYTNASSL